MREDPAFNLRRFVIAVMLVGISLVLGIYINDTIGSSLQDTNTPGSVVNESSGAGEGLNATANFTVNQAGLEDFAMTSVSALYNATSGNGSLINASNYSFTSAGLIYRTGADVLYPSVNASYSYTYTADTNASTAADDVVTALSTGTDWISILVVVGFATIILTMLTSGLGDATRREGAVPYY